GCRRRLGRAEADPERAALAGLRSKPDLTAHHVDHPLRDRQTQAEAVALEDRRAAIEAIEDPILFLRRDSLPGVLYLDGHGVVSPARGAKGNRARRRGVRAGVAE